MTTIQNKKQWFLTLNETMNDVRQYEQYVYKYNKYSDKPINVSRPILKGFYKKTNKVSSMVKKTLKRIPIILIVAAIIWIVSFIVFFVNNDTNLSSLGEIFNEYGPSSATKATTTSIISFFVALGVIAGINILTLNSICKKLEDLENSLYDVIKTIPPSYRTSEKMSTLAEIYFAKQSLSLEGIFNLCDEWLLEHATSKFMAIMFDTNYIPISNESAFLQAGTTDVIEEEQTETKSMSPKNNPDLPADIDSKTFSGSKDSKKDLNAMIGLESVKDQIVKLENRIKFYGKDGNNGNHMVFLGSAGTGKTSVARIITKILYDLGYIKKNQYVEVSGDYLKSGSSGRASAIIDYAMNGVLFIDEAYLLYDKNGNSAEATGVLLKAMEDRRTDFVVILAGYEEQMTRLLASNEGFSSRIKHTIYFPNYTIDEMVEIFNHFIHSYNKKSYELNADAEELLRQAFEAETKSRSFGNARTVRNAVDSIMDFYADRCMSSQIHSTKITKEDVEKYYEVRKKVLLHELQNSSAVNSFDEKIISLSELKPKLKFGSETPIEDLNNLVGMNDLLQEIETLKNQKEFYDEIQHQTILMVGENFYNKDIILKSFTGALYNLGYIKENKYLDISADFMKASYVGQSNKRASSIISYASGGVLVISNLTDLVESGDSFAQEVLNAIIDAIQNNDEITVVIMDRDSNYIENAIANLCTIVYEFPDFDNSQLFNVFVQLASNDGFSISEEAANKIQETIDSNITSINALNSFYNSVKKNHIANFNGTDNKFLITPEDIIFKTTLKLNFNKRSS